MSILGVSPIIIIIIVLFSLVAISLVIKWKRTQEQFRSGFWSLLRNRKNYFAKRPVIAGTFFIISIIFLTLALLHPQWGLTQSQAEAKGVDVVFTLDVSKSMKALDMDRNARIDRLTTAKAMIAEFIHNNPENRYGLVTFAGEAMVTTPLTFDHLAYLTFLDSVSHEDLTKQGTDISTALKQSIARFVQSEEEGRGQVIVLISDGGEEVENNYSPVAQTAKASGVKVVTVGIGSKEGVPIPEGQDAFGQIKYKTYQGEKVLTSLNEKPLQQIAEITGGEYFHAQNTGDLGKLENVYQNLKKTSLNLGDTWQIEKRYQLFLLPSLISFFIFLFILKSGVILDIILKKIPYLK